MVDTARTIVTDALRDAGVVADEETPTASQVVGGLRKFNNMIDAWNIDNLLVYGSTQYVFPFVPNKGTYTLGPGGDFNMPRPNSITSAYIRDTTLPLDQQMDYEIKIFNNNEYADIPWKNMQSTYPFMGVWFDDSFPLINVKVVPVPTTNQYSLVFWVNGIISNFALNDPILLAPGYKRALTANLVIELCDSYSIEPRASTVRIAGESKQGLMRQNVQIDELYTGGWRGYDVLTNRYY